MEAILDKLKYARLHDNEPLRSLPEISYVGNWRHNFNVNRIQASESTSSTPGSTVTLDVSGTPSKIVWIASKGPHNGNVMVSVCGGTYEEFSLWGWDSRVEFHFDIPAPCTEPEIRIRVLFWRFGERNVSVDAFEVWD